MIFHVRIRAHGGASPGATARPVPAEARNEVGPPPGLALPRTRILAGVPAADRAGRLNGLSPTRAAQRAKLTPNAARARVKCACPTEHRSEAVHLAFKPRRESESKQPTDETTALVYERRQIIQNRAS